MRLRSCDPTNNGRRRPVFERHLTSAETVELNPMRGEGAMSGFGELEECTALLSDDGARDRFWKENGYLFFRAALDRALVQGVREQLVEAFKAQGAVPPDASAEDFTLRSRDDVTED